MTEHTFTLPDGRTLGYALYGSADGWPVLYFHGTPSSRLEVQLLYQYKINVEQYLREAGLQLIAVDRPGMGLSHFNPQGTFISFSDDVHFLVRSLGIQHCSVLCWSGGGPYALAMAWRHPPIIKNVFILCAFSRRFSSDMLREINAARWYFRTARYAPWLLEACMNVGRKMNKSKSLPQWLTGLPDADYRLTEDPAHFKTLTTLTFREACRVSAKGAVHEARLYFNDFGFRLSDIQQPVHYWWGTEETTIHRLHAETVEQQVKNHVLHYKEGEGHLSLYIYFFTEALQMIRQMLPKSTS